MGFTPSVWPRKEEVEDYIPELARGCFSIAKSNAICINIYVFPYSKAATYRSSSVTSMHIGVASGYKPLWNLQS